MRELLIIVLSIFTIGSVMMVAAGLQLIGEAQCLNAGGHVVRTSLADRCEPR